MAIPVSDSFASLAGRAAAHLRQLCGESDSLSSVPCSHCLRLDKTDFHNEKFLRMPKLGFFILIVAHLPSASSIIDEACPTAVEHESHRHSSVSKQLDFDAFTSDAIFPVMVR